MARHCPASRRRQGGPARTHSATAAVPSSCTSMAGMQPQQAACLEDGVCHQSVVGVQVAHAAARAAAGAIKRRRTPLHPGRHGRTYSCTRSMRGAASQLRPLPSPVYGRVAPGHRRRPEVHAHLPHHALAASALAVLQQQEQRRAGSGAMATCATNSQHQAAGRACTSCTATTRCRGPPACSTNLGCTACASSTAHWTYVASRVAAPRCASAYAHLVR